MHERLLAFVAPVVSRTVSVDNDRSGVVRRIPTLLQSLGTRKEGQESAMATSARSVMSFTLLPILP